MSDLPSSKLPGTQAMRAALVVAGLLAAGCTWQAAPVPVIGDTGLLEGAWEGTYSSQQTGRTGSILFRLQAGADSAYGDVVMVPALPEELQHPAPAAHPAAAAAVRRPPRVLRISFVRCLDGIVTGVLDPYEDPESGEWVNTTFEGRLQGNVFLGAFSSYYRHSGQRVSGTWSVRRTKDKGAKP